MPSTSQRILTALLAAAVPSTAAAQAGSAYHPPKLARAGSNSASPAGAGRVTVQVFVKKDGSFTVTRVLASTNPGDDTAALQIARSSTYTPATRRGIAVDAYYDYVLRFASSGLSASDLSTAGAPVTGALAAPYAAIRAGKYADAKTGLQTYLQAHPGDTQAYTLLGVVSAFSDDSDGAAAAFDRVPSIPPMYSALAVQSYSKHTQALLNAQKYKDAATSANRLVQLEPAAAEGYYLRGVANANASDFQAALPDLQKALAIAKSGKSDAKNVATIEYSLAIAQLNTGAYDAAAATGKDLVASDPSLQPKLTQAAYTAVVNDAVALANAGKTSDAVARLEGGATTFPAVAAALYGQASYVMLTDKSPDYGKLKTESAKALALDPAEGRALFVSAFVAAHAGDQKTAIATLQKAKASPLYGSDAAFAKQVDDNLKKLSDASH